MDELRVTSTGLRVQSRSVENHNPTAAELLTATPEMIDDFNRRVDKSGECWGWTGKRAGSNNRYSALMVRGPDGKKSRKLYAHRVSAAIFLGGVPAGMVVDHLCRNTACVNPDHLEVVSVRENTLRGNAPGARVFRTGACAKGHPRTSENLRITRGRKGRETWECVPCVRQRQRKN